MPLTPKQILQAQEYHDKETRGGDLSPEEQDLLELWYAELEQDEALTLFGELEAPVNDPTILETLSSLQAQINELLVEITSATERLQTVTEQNNALQNEISRLRIKVGQGALLNAA